MFRAIRAMMRDPEGKVLVIAAVVTILVGTVVYMWLEGWSAVDALYFSVVTLATVGFGDLAPTTDVAKLFTVVYILTGVGIIAGFVSQMPRYQRPPARMRRAEHGVEALADRLPERPADDPRPGEGAE